VPINSQSGLKPLHTFFKLSQTDLPGIEEFRLLLNLREFLNLSDNIVAQFECGTRILRVIHGRDARATRQNASLPSDMTACPDLKPLVRSFPSLDKFIL
jgi:hypothetical protein